MPFFAKGNYKVDEILIEDLGLCSNGTLFYHMASSVNGQDKANREL